MVALQNWFRTEFAYDLSVQAGNSDDAVRQFLRIRRGYCEQFSATFAAMARSLGIPARVAIGFTPGELRDDGLYHVYDRHAHAWPEVWFDGFGWVSFEPTPGRGEPGAESHTGVGAAQDDTAADDGHGGGDAGRPTDPPTTVGHARAPGRSTRRPATRARTTTSVVPLTAAGGRRRRRHAVDDRLAIVALVVAWIAVDAPPGPLVRRHRRAPDAAGPGVGRVATGLWRAAHRRRAGRRRAPPRSSTPGWSSRRSASTQRVVGELARTVTRAGLRPAGVDDAAGRCAASSSSSRSTELCQPMIPWTTRVLARLDPRLARATG